eukprot:gene9045-16169_t
MQVSEYTLPAWRAAREEYERRMDLIEQRVSQKLKELFRSTILPSLMAANPTQPTFPVVESATPDGLKRGDASFTTSSHSSVSLPRDLFGKLSEPLGPLLSANSRQPAVFGMPHAQSGLERQYT